MTEMPIDYSAIEKSLSNLWRGEKEGENAVTRAALWNVIAHTTTSEDHSTASQVLARTSEAVPSRAIIIRADRNGADEISSWISANCHRVGGEKQVCSEEVAIVAGGSKIRHVPPLVNALLIPDMPVAVWWLGDLPNERYEYVETLLDTADRLIVDSSKFDSPVDLEWLHDIADRTFTAPADLNWVRLEDWRVATAAIFDAPAMRSRLQQIRELRVTAIGSKQAIFGDSIESLYYASWLTSQADLDQIEFNFCVEQGTDDGSVVRVEMKFADGTGASINRDPRGVLFATVGGMTQTIDCVTRILGRGPEDLIVRQLKRPEADKVFVKLLPIAMQLASKTS